MSLRKRFDPVSSGLEESFRLTRFSNLLGAACRAPAEVNKTLLEGHQGEKNEARAHTVSGSCQIVRSKNTYLDIFVASDVVYPPVDDPYAAGKAACAHCLSPIYACGVPEIESVNILLTSSTKMSDRERDVVLPQIVDGFRDCCKDAYAVMTQSPLALNPSLMIAGQVTAFVPVGQDFVASDRAEAGDVLVLTKPLGTHVACTAHMWMEQNQEKWNRIKQVITEQDVERGYRDAMFNMARLNRNASALMGQFNAHGATAVAGYGILGHAKLLAKRQRNQVNFVIHNLPVFTKMNTIAKAMGNTFGLQQGVAPEISGGLLVALPREQAAKFCADLRKLEGHQAWIVGIVEAGDGNATVIDRPRIIEVVTGEDGTVQSAPPSSSSSRRSVAQRPQPRSAPRPGQVSVLRGRERNQNDPPTQAVTTSVSTIVAAPQHHQNQHQNLQTTSVNQAHPTVPTITFAPSLLPSRVVNQVQGHSSQHHPRPLLPKRVPQEESTDNLTELRTTSTGHGDNGSSMIPSEIFNGMYYGQPQPVINMHHPQSVIHSTIPPDHRNPNVS